MFALGLACFSRRQCLPATLQLRRREESLSLTLWVVINILTRVGMFVAYAPGLGKVHHLRENTKHTVCLIRDMRIRAMKLRDVSRGDRSDALFGEKRIEKEFDA